MRVAVVTGASSGIGREFVRQLEYFYKDLDEIWVIARREERLEQLGKKLMFRFAFLRETYRKNMYTDNFIQSFVNGTLI